MSTCSAPQNAVEFCPGANLADFPLRPDRHDHEELECPCSASQARAMKNRIRSLALAPTVPPSAPGEPGACENDGVKKRSWALGQPAQGCANRGPGTPPPACGTGASRICTKGHASILCSTMCRSTLTCDTGSVTDPGRQPPRSSSRLKAPAGEWGVPDRRRKVHLAPPLPCSGSLLAPRRALYDTGPTSRL